MKKRQKKKNFFFDNFLKKNRKGVISEYLPWLLIALAVLAILMITIFLLQGKGISLVDKIKNFFGGAGASGEW
ncbi:hypothetical protein KAT24_03050 [Candidatus Pacearchaeota archaeon]|nr:hypothetical protein [Candidatus Pacearchaeota archaeon]